MSDWLDKLHERTNRQRQKSSPFVSSSEDGDWLSELYANAHVIDPVYPTLDTRGKAPINTEEESTLDFVLNNLAAGAGRSMENWGQIIESGMRPENMTPSEWKEHQSPLFKAIVGNMQDTGREIYDRNIRQYDDETLEYYLAQLLQSAPETAATVALSIAAGGPVGGLLGAAGRGAGSLLMNSSKARDIAWNLAKASQSSGLGGKALRAFTPSSSKAAGAVLSGDVLESLSEANSTKQEYIEDAKRNGTYIPDVTELEAEAKARADFYGNFGWIGLMNIPEYNMFFGKGAKGIGQKLLRGLLGAGSEGVEEGGQEIINAWALDKPTDWKRVQDAAIVGSMMGAGFQGAGYVSDRVRGVPTEAEIEEAQNFVRGQAKQYSQQTQDIYGNFKGGFAQRNEEAARAAYREASGENGIDNFMRAIVQQESGGNYDEINSDSGASGAFQIMPDNWSAWAQDAGLPADAPMTKENQNLVARNKMQEYYAKFGNWRDVAIAWYGGEGAVGYSEEAKSRPQYSSGNAYPSINEYADSVMSRFESLGGQKPDNQTRGGYVGENGKGEGTYWVRNEGASLDGAQPDLLNAIDMLGKYFYDKTGKQLVVTAGTNGDHPSNGSEHGHDAGWKVDIADAGANGVGINEDGALFTANFEAQPFLKDFIAYGRSLGLGMNLEGEGTSNVHIDVALDGTQWDGNGEHAGGFNPRSVQSRANQIYSENSNTPQWQDYRKQQENRRQEEANKSKEPPKPLFDLNAEDSTTQKLLEQFATQNLMQESDRLSRVPDGNYGKFDFFDGMFNEKGEFQNTKENRDAIRQRYGDEFTEWATKYFTQGQTNKQDKTQTAQPNKTTSGKANKSTSDYTDNSPLITATDNFLEKLRNEGGEKNAETLLKLQIARRNGDTAEMENILRQNGVEIPQAQPQKQTQEDPVKENKPPENVLSKTDQARLNLAQKTVNTAKGKKAKDNRKRQGKAIVELAQMNGISMPLDDADALRVKGDATKLTEWQDKLRQAGVFDTSPSQKTTNQAPAHNFIVEARKRAYAAAGKHWRNTKNTQQEHGEDLTNEEDDTEPSAFDYLPRVEDLNDVDDADVEVVNKQQQTGINPETSDYLLLTEGRTDLPPTGVTPKTDHGVAADKARENRIAQENIDEQKKQNAPYRLIDQKKAAEEAKEEENLRQARLRDEEKLDNESAQRLTTPEEIQANYRNAQSLGDADANERREQSREEGRTWRETNAAQSAQSPPDDEADRLKQSSRKARVNAGKEILRLLRSPEYADANKKADAVQGLKTALANGSVEAIRQARKFIAETNNQTRQESQQTPPVQTAMPAQPEETQSAPFQRISPQDLEREADLTNEEDNEEPSAFDYLPKTENLNDVDLAEEETPEPESALPSKPQKNYRPIKGHNRGRKMTAKDRLYDKFKVDTHPNIKAHLDDLIQKAASDKDSQERRDAIATLDGYRKSPPVSDESLDAFETSFERDKKISETNQRADNTRSVQADEQARQAQEQAQEKVAKKSHEASDNAQQALAQTTAETVHRNKQEIPKPAKEISREEEPANTEPNEPPAQTVEESQPDELAKPTAELRGDNTTIVSGGNKKYRVQYKVVEADSIVTSHKMNKSVSVPEPNPQYPETMQGVELQPRNRDTAAAAVEVNRMANDLNPGMVLDNAKLNDGAPVVRHDGDNVVINGNWRALAISYAYDIGKADHYKQALIDKAEWLGLDGEEIKKMNRPVLVREMTSDLNKEQLQDITTDQTGGAKMDDTAQARADAAKLKPSDFGDLPENGIVDTSTAAGKDFLQVILGRFISVGEVQGYTDPQTNRISQSGIRRALNALLAKAYGDSNLINNMVTSTDETNANMGSALRASGSYLAKIQTYMQKGLLHSYDLSPIAEAANKNNALRAEGKAVKDYLNEYELEGMGLSAESKEILKFLDKHKRFRPTLTDFFMELGHKIEDLGEPQTGEDLFGNAPEPPPPLMDLIKAAETRAEELADERRQSNKKSKSSEPEPQKQTSAPEKQIEAQESQPEAIVEPQTEPAQVEPKPQGNTGTFKLLGTFETIAQAHNFIREHYPEVEDLSQDKGGAVYEVDTGKRLDPELRLTYGDNGTWLLEQFTATSRKRKTAEEKQQEETKKKEKADKKRQAADKKIIDEAKSNSDIANALDQLGVKIEGDKIIAPDEAARQAADVIVKRVTAYHGSPYKFKAFSTDNIGTGEGAQAHGWGLYFAQDKEQAEDYKDKFSFPIVAVDGKFISQNKLEKNFATLYDAVTETEEDVKAKDIPNVIIKKLTDKLAKITSPGLTARVKEIIKQIKSGRITFTKPVPRLYTVELPSAGRMLDLNKTFAEQPPLVKKALTEIAEQRGITLTDKLTGANIYTAIAKTFGIEIAFAPNSNTAKQTSLLLNEHGIEGNTYEGRADGRCYVVFNDKAIKILKTQKSLYGNGNTDVTNVLENKDLTLQQRVWVELGEKLGVKTVFFDNPNGDFHGVHDRNVTFLNVNSKLPLCKVFWHETLHWLRNNNPELYQRLVKAANITVAQRQAFLKETGRTDIQTPDEINEEILADMMIDTAKRTGLLQSIAGKNRGLIERVVQWLKDTMNKFIDHFRNPSGKLTTKQSQSLADEFGRIATQLKDPNGDKIFRYNRRTGNIELADGRDLSKAAIEGMTRKGANSGRKLSASNSANTDTNPNSRQSLTQTIRNKLSSWFNADTPSTIRNRRIKTALQNITGHRIIFDYTNSDTAIIDDFNKVIQAKNAYDWEKFLPQIGGKLAQTLNLEPTKEQANYIADWLLTGALNNTSAEARAFQAAMRNNPAKAELFQSIRDDFQEYTNLSAGERVGEGIQRKNKPLLRQLWDMRHDTQEQFTDDLHPVYRMLEEMKKTATPAVAKLIDEQMNIYKSSRILRGKGAVADMMIEGNGKDIDKIRTTLQEQNPGVKFDRLKTIQTILEDVGALDPKNGLKNLEDFEKYCLAKLDKEIHEHNRKNPERHIEPLKDEADDDAVIAAGDGKFKQAQKDLVTFSNVVLTMRYRAGMMSQNHYSAIINKWKNYIPMVRVFEENEDFDFYDSLKPRKGGKRGIRPPIESIIKNTQQFIAEAERNKVKLELAGLVRCGNLGTIIAEVETGSDKGNIVFFHENGKRKRLEVADLAIKRAIDSLQAQDESTWIMKALKASSVAMRGLYTLWNPDYAAGNLPRDMADAFIHNKHLNANPFIAAMEVWNAGIREVLNKSKSQEYYDWLANGGSQSGFISADTDYAQREINSLTKGTRRQRYTGGVKSFFSQAWDDITRIAEISENMTRFNTYKAALNNLAKQRADGKATLEDKRTAALASRDASIDFAKSGKSMRQINRAILFSNAAIQAWTLWGRTVRDAVQGKPGARKELAGKVFRAAAEGVILALVSSLANFSDDDRYKKFKNANDWERDTYWIFGDFKIPKGMDVSIRLMSSLTEELVDNVIKNDPVEGKRLFKAFSDALPSLTATILTPAVETSLNRSWFRDAPIVPVTEQHLEPYKQYGKDTSTVAKLFGEAFNVSPRKVDYLINGYLGFMGRFGSRVPDYIMNHEMPLREMPMVRRFLFDPSKNPRIVKEYYEKFNEQETKWRTYQQERKQGKKVDLPDGYDRALHKRLESIQEAMRNISKQEKRIIDDPKLTYAQRKEKLQKLEERRVKLCEKVFNKAR